MLLFGQTLLPQMLWGHATNSIREGAPLAYQQDTSDFFLSILHYPRLSTTDRHFLETYEIVIVNMSFPRFRRQHHQQAFSPTSSEDLSPTVPVLDNPITFQALAARFVPEVSLRKKKKQGRAAAMPSMFLEEEKEEEDTPAPNLVRASSEDGKPDNAAKKNVEEAQARKTRTQYYDDIFNSRGPEHSSKTLITHDSVVVVEIKTNIKVCYYPYCQHERNNVILN